MTLARFLNYVQYSRECPADIYPPRWNAMLRWLELNECNVP